MLVDASLFQNIVNAYGLAVTVDQATQFQLVARVTLAETTYLVRVGASRCTVWDGREKVANTSGRDWIVALTDAIAQMFEYAAAGIPMSNGGVG